MFRLALPISLPHQFYLDLRNLLLCFRLQKYPNLHRPSHVAIPAYLRRVRLRSLFAVTRMSSNYFNQEPLSIIEPPQTAPDSITPFSDPIFLCKLLCADFVLNNNLKALARIHEIILQSCSISIQPQEEMSQMLFPENITPDFQTTHLLDLVPTLSPQASGTPRFLDASENTLVEVSLELFQKLPPAKRIMFPAGSLGCLKNGVDILPYKPLEENFSTLDLQGRDWVRAVALTRGRCSQCKFSVFSKGADIATSGVRGLKKPSELIAHYAFRCEELDDLDPLKSVCFFLASQYENKRDSLHRKRKRQCTDELHAPRKKTYLEEASSDGSLPQASQLEPSVSATQSEASTIELPLGQLESRHSEVCDPVGASESPTDTGSFPETHRGVEKFHIEDFLKDTDFEFGEAELTR